MKRTNKYFMVDWIVHSLMGIVLPVLYTIDCQHTNDALIMCICVFVLSIPVEGYFLLLSQKPTKSEKIAFEAVCLHILTAMFFFGFLSYNILRYSDVDLRLLLWANYLLAIITTVKAKGKLNKYLQVLEKSNNVIDV